MEPLGRQHPTLVLHIWRADGKHLAKVRSTYPVSAETYYSHPQKIVHSDWEVLTQSSYSIPSWRSHPARTRDVRTAIRPSVEPRLPITASRSTRSDIVHRSRGIGVKPRVEEPHGGLAGL